MTDITNATVNGSDNVDSNVAAATSTPAVDTPTTTTTTTTKPDTLRDSLSAAFDKLAEKQKEAAPAAPETPAAETTKPVTGALPTDKPAEPAKAVDPITGRELEPIKAPGGWTPALREKWGQLPRDVQQFIKDSERDVSTTLQQTKEAREFQRSWTDVLSPYESIMKQHNVNASQHVKELLAVSHTLNTGTPQQKAQQIYHMINTFKPDAATLTALFSGQQPNVPAVQAPVAQQQTQQPNVDELVKQRMEETTLNSEIEAMASNPTFEFFDYLKPAMSKAIDAGFVKGETYNELLKNAYEFAARNDTEVQKVLATRAPVAATPATPAAAAKPAAKPIQSIKPSMGTSARSEVARKPMSIREAAAKAFDDLAG